MNKNLDNLIDKIEKEAKSIDMPIDKDVYKSCSKDLVKPILYAGNLDAEIGFIARDLGKDEVIKGEPLIGSAGQLVRRTLSNAFFGVTPSKTEIHHKEVMDKVLFTNIVPYKPIGNKVFPKKVRTRFMPFIAEFLITYWKGSHIITLGTEAFKWFEYFENKQKLAEFWNNEEQRYTESIECEITTQINGQFKYKTLTVSPLPHPSPLNAKWYKRFPNLLKNRVR
jgi:uracil-DNA glycosylase